MAHRLFLDDIRDPPNDGNDWAVVRSYSEAALYVKDYGVPDFISFDHDLGYEDGMLNRTGMDFAKWLTFHHLSDQYPFPKGFSYTVHSANPVGSENIRGLMNNFLAHINQSDNEVNNV